jgi:hypothetical protein
MKTYEETTAVYFRDENGELLSYAESNKQFDRSVLVASIGAILIITFVLLVVL